jgi:hypothetical protein
LVVLYRLLDIAHPRKRLEVESREGSMPKLKAWLAGRWVAGAGFMAGALIALVPMLRAS